MKQIKKRWLALLLAATLLVFDTSAVFATEGISPDDPAVVEQVTEENAESEAGVNESVLAEEKTEDEDVVDPNSEDTSDETVQPAETDEAVEVEDVDELENTAEESETEDLQVIDENMSEYAELFAACADAADFKLFGNYEADKKELRSHMNEIICCQEGVNYVPGQIIVEVDSKEQAEEYARAYSGKLLQVGSFWALIELNADPKMGHATVMDAVMASQRADSKLPAAYPNYIRVPYSEAGGGGGNSRCK